MSPWQIMILKRLLDVISLDVIYRPHRDLKLGYTFTNKRRGVDRIVGWFGRPVFRRATWLEAKQKLRIRLYNINIYPESVITDDLFNHLELLRSTFEVLGYIDLYPH